MQISSPLKFHIEMKEFKISQDFGYNDYIEIPD